MQSSKSFEVRIQGQGDRVWTIASRGYNAVLAQLTARPKDYDLPSGKINGLVTVKCLRTNKERYFRLREEGMFIFDAMW